MNERIDFRALRREDFGLLQRWQLEPYVARWWGPPPSVDELEAKYGRRIDGVDPTQVFVVELGGAPIGIIQAYLVDDDPAWAARVDLPDAVGIDYYIGDPSYVGLGIGTAMLKAFVRKTFSEYPTASCIAVGVLRGNRPSWRALENAGFERRRELSLESDQPWDRGPGYLYVLIRGHSRAE